MSYIGADSDRTSTLGANLGCDSFGSLTVDIADNNGCPSFGEATRHCPPQPRATTSDISTLFGKIKKNVPAHTHVSFLQG
jgi:hypothetical protein